MKRRLLKSSLAAGAIALMMGVGAGSAAAALEVKSLEAEQVGPYSAVLRGEVNKTGIGNVRVGFEYGQTTAYGNEIEAANITEGTGWIYFEKKITGLDANTDYHFRAGAVNHQGSAYGEDRTFTTLAALEVRSLDAKVIGPHSAVLHGEVKMWGPNVIVGFEYGETTAYGSEIEAANIVNEGSGWYPFEKRIDGLEDSSDIHFRAGAVNYKEVAVGEDLSFSTTQPIFEAELYPADLEGGQYTGDPLVMGVEKGTFNCDSVSVTGQMSSATSMLEFAPAFEGCELVGFIGPKISLNGCSLVFQAEAGTSDSMGIDCPAGKVLEVQAGTCLMSIPAQSGVGSVDAGRTDQLGESTLRLDLDVSGLQYTKKDGFLCKWNGSGAMEDGTLTGTLGVGAEYNEEAIDLGFAE